MSEKTEKTAISIKSVLATYLKSLCYIRDENNPFSIRQWIHHDSAAEWLFISSTGDRHESLKPLIYGLAGYCDQCAAEFTGKSRAPDLGDFR